MGWNTNKVKAAVKLLRPELTTIASYLTYIGPDTYVADVTANLPLYLSGAFKHMDLKVITGPKSLRISWEWQYPDGGFNGKDLVFMELDPDTDLRLELETCADAVEEPDPELAMLLRKAVAQL